MIIANREEVYYFKFFNRISISLHFIVIFCNFIKFLRANGMISVVCMTVCQVFSLCMICSIHSSNAHTCDSRGCRFTVLQIAL